MEVNSSSAHSFLEHNSEWVKVHMHDSTEVVYQYVSTSNVVRNITVVFSPASPKYAVYLDKKPLLLDRWGFPSTLSFSCLQALTKFFPVARPCLGHLKGDKKLPVSKFISVSVRPDTGKQCIHDTRCTGVRPLLSTSECCPRCYRTFYDVSRASAKKISPQNPNQDPEPDMKVMLQTMAPTLDNESLSIIHSMLTRSNSNPKEHRWGSSTIRLALNIWTASPKAYQDISDKLPLPSVRLLQYYKNFIHQKPGFVPEMLQWMHHTAEQKKLPQSARRGGLIFDEMSIQQDLQLDKTGGDETLIGTVELSPECCHMDTIRQKQISHPLATHVLQMEFLGFSGFHFPVAHFPTSGIQAHQLIPLYWECVRHLLEFDFHVDFTLFDGATSNRSFLKSLFYPSDPISRNMTIPNLEEKGGFITLGLDVKHVVKRVRNNINSSGNGTGYTRLLRWQEKDIVWDH